MKWHLLFQALIFLPVVSVFAQDAKTTADKEAAYTLSIHTRAQKIVATRNISVSPKAARVTNNTASQYRSLNEIHTKSEQHDPARK